MKRGSTRSHSVEKKILKELWTCHRTDYIMNELQIRATMNFNALHPIVLWKISSSLFTAIKRNSLLNPTVYARCASVAVPSSGMKVHHLKPKWTCVKSTLQFVRSHIDITLDYCGFFIPYLFILLLKPIVKFWDNRLQNAFNTCPFGSFKVWTSMPECGQGWPKHVGYCNRKALKSNK